MKKKKKVTILFLLMLASVSLSACTQTEAYENSDISVKTIKPEISKITGKLEYSGNLEGGKESYIATKIPGQISSIEVSIGDEIKRKQVLARLTGEENYTSQNTAYISYQNSVANLQNTNQVMDQKINGAQASLETARKNLLAIKMADQNEDSVSEEQIKNAKLNLDLLEINLVNLDNVFAQKEKDILDSVVASIDQAKILVKDILTYLYLINNENLPDTNNNFDIKSDFSVKNTKNIDLAESAILEFKNGYYQSENILNNNLGLDKESILLRRDTIEKILNLSKIVLSNMNNLVADSISSAKMSQNELDNYRYVLTNYSTQVSNTLLSQSSGQVVGIIGVRQMLENLEIEKENNRRELNKQIEMAKNGIDLLESTVKATQDDLSSKIAIAEAQVKEAEAGLKDAKQSKILQDRVTKTQVDLAKGSLNMANVQTANTLLKAPYDGVVVEKLEEEGVVVGAGKPILKVADVSYYKIVIYIPETEIKNIKVGQVADVQLESFLDEKIEASVVRISPKIEESSKKVRVELAIEKKDFFKIGMYATVKFDIEADQSVLLLPKSSVNEVYGENFVYIVNDGRVEVKKVRVGKEIDGRSEIREGINENYDVILNYSNDIKEGVEVQIVN